MLEEEFSVQMAQPVPSFLESIENRKIFFRVGQAG